VDLREHRDLATREPVHEVELPERSRTVERPRHDAGHLLGQLRVGPRSRQRQLADVEVEVEMRVVEPVRVVQAERDLGQPPPERREQRQAPGDQVVDGLEGELSVGPGGGIEDGKPAHVPALARRLERQELRVDTC
jgi:hypothetical protein